MFIYTREAHPGENVPRHGSFEDKLAGAARLREEAGIGRDILVDGLAGTVHRGYGCMPDMTWVIDRGGRCLQGELDQRRQCRSLPGPVPGRPQPGTARGTPARYETEQADFRHTDRQRFTEQLRRNGPRAVAEFEKATELWARRPAT